MRRNFQAVLFIGVLLVASAMGLPGCGGGGGGGGAAGGDPAGAPTAFNLLTPATGATGVALSSPAFTWENSTGETSYTLQLSTSNTFASIFYQNASLAANVTAFTLPAANPLSADTVYYWRVVAVNTAGTYTSPVFSFTTSLDAPTAFALLSPANAATSVAFSSPVFNWQNSTGESAYTFQLSLNSSFAPMTYETSITANVTTFTLPALNPLALNTPYYWRVIALNSAGTYTTPAWSFTTKKSGDSVWSTSSSASSLGADFDRAYGVARDANAFYTVGYDTKPGFATWRIEKRAPGNGALVAAFGTGGMITNITTTRSVANAIAIDAADMYVAGYDAEPGYRQWRIEKRDLATGAAVTVIRSNPSAGDAAAYAVAVDSAHMYVAGYDTTPGGDLEWRIEKRDIATGATVTVITRHPGSGDDEAYGIAVDANAIYVVGYDTVDGINTPSWRMEKFDINTGATLTYVRSNANSYGCDAVPYSIKIDAGHMYIAGYDIVSDCTTTTNWFFRWRVEKRGLNGIPDASFGPTNEGFVTTDLSASSSDAIPNALAIDAGYIYAAGYDTNTTAPEQWRIEKRNITTGALVSSFGTGGVVNLNASLGLTSNEAWAIAGDTDYLYTAGDMWHFEKRVK